MHRSGHAATSVDVAATAAAVFWAATAPTNSNHRAHSHDPRYMATLDRQTS